MVRYRRVLRRSVCVVEINGFAVTVIDTRWNLYPVLACCLDCDGGRCLVSTSFVLVVVDTFD